MIKDNKRRKIFKEYAPDRIRLNIIRKNTILPSELQVTKASDILMWHVIYSYIIYRVCVHL